MKNKKTKFKTILTLIIFFSFFGVVESSEASVDLPWSTTYDCDDWLSYNDTLDCSGLDKGLNVTTSEGAYEQITSSANYPSGGGSGQRHWVGYNPLNSPYPGKNDSSGGTSVTFNILTDEVWIRFYVRFQANFNWGFMNGYKMLYIYTRDDKDMPFYFPYSNDGISIYPPGSSVQDGCRNCGWETQNMNSGNWTCVEIHLKRETASKDDGEFDIWINGTLQAPNFSNGFNFFMIDRDDHFSGFTIASNLDRTGADLPDEYIDYDDIAVYNTTPPNIDSEGNPFIGPIESSDTTPPSHPTGLGVE